MVEFECPCCGQTLFKCQKCGGIFSVEDGMANLKGEAVFCVPCHKVVRDLSN